MPPKEFEIRLRALDGTLTLSGQAVLDVDSGVGEPPVEPEPGDRPSAAQMNAMLKIGISLGNALEAPNEGDWGVVLEEDDFRSIADAGFSHVRIAARTSNHADGSGKIKGSFIARLMWTLDMSEKYKLRAIFDPIHHHGSFMGDPNGQMDRTVAIVRELAKRTADRRNDFMSAEICNEPKDNAKGSALNTYMRRAIEAIREHSPNRIVLIGAPTNNATEPPADFDPPSDPLLIMSGHCYSDKGAYSNAFTHQGVMGRPMLGKWTTRAEGIAFAKNRRDNIKAWAAKRGMPARIDEYGCSKPAPQPDRFDYIKAMSEVWREGGLPVTVWDHRSRTFGLYDKGTGWQTGALEALGLT